MDSLGAVRALIVDDHEHTRAIMSAVLVGAGLRSIKHAEDGADALALVQSWTPDVAFIDYHMAEMDGVAFTKAVRTSTNASDRFLPIIMLTAHSDEARIRAARDAGVTEIIVKPAVPAVILDRLSRVIFKPRPFVKAETYFGPDRRRHTDPAYDGPHRRATDTPRSAEPGAE